MSGEKKKKNGILLSLKRTFAAAPWSAAFYCMVKVLYGILPAIYVVLYARFIDDILLFYGGDIALGIVLRDALPVVLLLVFQYCGGILGDYLKLRCNLRIVHAEKGRLMEKCSRIPYQELENSDFQDLRYSVDQGIDRYIVSGMVYGAECAGFFLNLLSILWLIFTYSWFGALAVLVCFVPIIVVSTRSGKEDYSAFEKYQAAERRMGSYEEILTSGKYADERIVYGHAGWIIDKWKKKFDEASDILLRVKRKTYTSVKVTSMIIRVVLLAVVAILIYMASRGGITLGTCTMLITQILSMSTRMTWNFSAYLHGLFATGSYMQSYDKFYAAPDMPERKRAIERLQGIEFKDVSFRYGEGLPNVLEHLSFRLEPGHTYALVGENGAGKTTIMKLLLGLYDHYEGSILVNGIELREISNLNQVFSAMFQDYTRYEISIRDNIRMAEEADSGQAGDADIGQSGDADILRMMGELQLDLSEQMAKEGLDAQIGRLGEENKDLSGGQWQRLAMLRSMVHPGEFLILDEPTAALDPMAENAIYQDFRDMTKGRGALLITHRLGAARLSDRILVLQGGRLAEEGNHEELLAAGGLYAMMFESQKGWYEDEKA